MIRHVLSVVVILANVTAFAGPPESFDWPQWQGPDRNAISQERGLLQEWPAEGPPLAWRIEGVGGGYGAPAIAAGQILGLSNRDDDEVVWALAEADGKELWVTKLGPACREGGPQGMEGPGCTPTVDGERLYVLGAGGLLACLNVSDGSIVWKRNLIDDFKGRRPMWRYNESPLVDGDKVICTPGADEAMLVALNKLTGETIWTSQMPPSAASGPGGPGGTAAPGGPGAAGGQGPAGAQGPPSGQGAPGGPGRGRGGRGGGFAASGAGYASAIAIDFEGQRQYVQLTSRALIGVDAADGKLLWRYDRPANRMGISCSTPLYHDGTVFAASAYGAGGGLVKLTKDSSGGVKAEEVYATRDMQNHHGGMVLIDGCLYGGNGGNEGGYLACLDFKTGEVLWSERDAGKRRAEKGAVAFADGRLYYRTESGTLLLIEASPKEYVERGRFEQPDRSEKPAWTHPVIANGKLYVRDQDILFCYDVKAK